MKTSKVEVIANLFARSTYTDNLYRAQLKVELWKWLQTQTLLSWDNARVQTTDHTVFPLEER